MKKTLKKALSFLLLTIMLSGCATIFSSSSEQINIYSKPPAAEVYINGQFKGNTPLVNFKLKSNRDYFIEIKKDGFVTYSTTIYSEIGVGWVVLDILGGLLPVVVDAATGAWYELDQTDIGAVLTVEPEK